MAWFRRLDSAKKDLEKIFSDSFQFIEPVILKKSEEKKNIKLIHEKLDESVVILRREINKWMRALVRDSARMGLKHSGQALLPFFKKNSEAYDSVLDELAMLEDVPLIEARLNLGLAASFIARSKPTVKTSSDKWSGVLQKIMNVVTKKTTTGLKPSERVWDLTQRMRLEMRRKIVADVTQGRNPTVIAREMKKFLSPGVLDGTNLGPGVYKSPFKNAFRMAQTEANRAYSHAEAEFAKDKSWIQGVQVTLSPVHSDSDECDDLANRGVMTPEKFQGLIPAHPQCRCYATYVLKDDIFEDKEAA